MLLIVEDYEKALGVYEKILARYPDFHDAINGAMIAHWGLGQIDEAEQMADRWRQSIGKPDGDIEALVQALRGNPVPREDLEQHLKYPINAYSDPSSPATLYDNDLLWILEVNGATDLALERVGAMADSGRAFIPYVRLDPRLKSLRCDQRFEDVMAQLNLPPVPACE